MMKSIKDVPYLKNKKVLVRTDFDVPVSDEGKILEDHRIKKQKPMLDYLINKEAQVTMLAHISAIDSFKSITPQLEEIIGHKIGNQLNLLDNVRKFDGEMENDKLLAKKLSSGFDIYVNNDFAVSHRNHASVSMITKFLPSYAGFVIEDETKMLKKIIDHPSEGKIFIVGGAKTASKLKTLRGIIDKSDKILVGGILANDILKVSGVDVGASEVDDNAEELLNGLDISDSRLVLPCDFTITDNMFRDIGAKSISRFKEHIIKAKMILWSGPLGYYEHPEYAIGTNEVARAIAEAGAFRVLGGGDTITAVDRIGLLDKFDFVSTGGGAMLEFLAGDRLPGLEALNYY